MQSVVSVDRKATSDGDGTNFGAGDEGVDPTKPLDPIRVLAFDPARMGAVAARAELEELKRDTWAVNPVVVFGKVR